ncbi:MAG: hypothetical protein RLZZ105_163 [Actinomycetota bacterium]
MSFLATSLALGSADYSWRRNASCKDTDPELFFPIGTVCDECAVRGKCLDFALETNQDWGIWGGMSEEERRDIRRRRAAERRTSRQLA